MKEKERKAEKIKELFFVSRPLNWVMAGIGVFVGSLAGVGLNSDFILPIALAILATIFTMGAGNALNNLYDRNIDKIVHGKRSLASGRLSPQVALWFTVVSFVVGFSLALTLAWFFNPVCLIIASFNLLVILLYEIRLKKRGLTGNLAIGYLVCSVFLFGGAAVGKITHAIIIVAILAFLVTVGREIVKDIRDMPGDKGKRKTLPMKIGEKRARIISVLFIGLAIVLSVLLWYWRLLGDSEIPYIFLAIPVPLFFTSACSIARLFIWDLKKADILLKAGMLFALIPLVLGGIL